MTSKIPQALRRKVFMRDKFCCVVPGCTAKRFLDVHHILHREHGGKHTMANLCVLCFHHHKAHHDGLLVIEGTAPHGLTFRWVHEDASAFESIAAALRNARSAPARSSGGALAIEGTG